jgi:phage tail sheath protein FI
VLGWRARFGSSYAAAYHPWLRVPSPHPAGGLITIPPTGAAAGLLARSERQAGVPRGPANLPVVGPVDLTAHVTDAEHDELHQAGVNAFRLRPDAVWLAGARTLSRDRAWRQLSVRRLVSLVERAVAHQLQWTVFEPNDDQLRSGLVRLLEGLLGTLFEQGAFAGATPAESWFVRVAAGPDTAAEADRGEVVVEVGVAPSEPTEFILVRVRLEADGATQVRSRALAVGA